MKDQELQCKEVVSLVCQIQCHHPSSSWEAAFQHLSTWNTAWGGCACPISQLAMVRSSWRYPQRQEHLPSSTWRGLCTLYLPIINNTSNNVLPPFLDINHHHWQSFTKLSSWSPFQARHYILLLWRLLRSLTEPSTRFYHDLDWWLTTEYAYVCSSYAMDQVKLCHSLIEGGQACFLLVYHSITTWANSWK